MFCPKCGKELPEDAVFCSACGCMVKEKRVENNQPTYKKQNGLGIAGFIVSLVGIFIPYYFVVPLTGLILSICGLIQAKKKNESTGLSLAGVIIASAYIGLLLLIIVFAFILPIYRYHYVYDYIC